MFVCSHCMSPRGRSKCHSPVASFLAFPTPPTAAKGPAPTAYTLKDVSNTLRDYLVCIVESVALRPRLGHTSSRYLGTFAVLSVFAAGCRHLLCLWSTCEVSALEVLSEGFCCFRILLSYYIWA